MFGKRRREREALEFEAAMIRNAEDRLRNPEIGKMIVEGLVDAMESDNVDDLERAIGYEDEDFQRLPDELKILTVRTFESVIDDIEGLAEGRLTPDQFADELKNDILHLTREAYIQGQIEIPLTLKNPGTVAAYDPEFGFIVKARAFRDEPEAFKRYINADIVVSDEQIQGDDEDKTIIDI